MGLTKGSRRPAEPIRRGAGFFSAIDGPAAVSFGLGAGSGDLVPILVVPFFAAMDTPTDPFFAEDLGFTGSTLTGGAGLCATALGVFAVAGFAAITAACASSYEIRQGAYDHLRKAQVAQARGDYYTAARQREAANKQFAKAQRRAYNETYPGYWW